MNVVPNLRRFLALLLCLLVSSQTLGSPPEHLVPNIYLPRFEFICSNGKGLAHCSDAELREIGGAGQPVEIERQLINFTSLVLQEAENREAHAKEIRGLWTKSKDAVEADLTRDWKRLGAHESSRPWIIDDRIEIMERKKGELRYIFEFQARKVGQDDVFSSRQCDAPLGTFSETYYKIYPQVGERLKEIRMDILSQQ